MERGLAGFLAFGAGVAAVAAGAVYYANKRQPGPTGTQTGGLGRGRSQRQRSRAVQGQVESNGMTLTHHRSKMPIKERAGLLQDLVYKSVQDPEMRKLALQITKDCPARDGQCEAKAIDAWVRRNIRYTGDIGPHKLGRNGPVEGVDLFQTAARTVEFGGGDCDDQSVLNCTLAILNGMACKFRITSPTKRSGVDDFTHIYAMAGLPKNKPGRFVAMDTTLPGGKLGTEYPFGKSLDVIA